MTNSKTADKEDEKRFKAIDPKTWYLCDEHPMLLNKIRDVLGHDKVTNPWWNTKRGGKYKPAEDNWDDADDATGEVYQQYCVPGEPGVVYETLNAWQHHQDEREREQRKQEATKEDTTEDSIAQSGEVEDIDDILAGEDKAATAGK